MSLFGRVPKSISVENLPFEARLASILCGKGIFKIQCVPVKILNVDRQTDRQTDRDLNMLAFAVGHPFQLGLAGNPDMSGGGHICCESLHTELGLKACPGCLDQESKG